jgi:hypothetical protein
VTVDRGDRGVEVLDDRHEAVVAHPSLERDGVAVEAVAVGQEGVVGGHVDVSRGSHRWHR